MGNTVLARPLFDELVFDLPEARLLPNIHDTIFQGALYNDQTIWPLGFVIPSSAIYVEE